MRTRNKEITPAEMERQLYDADQGLDELFPQNEEELREAMQMYGSTPVDVPEKLRSGKEVLARIKERESTSAGASEFGKLISTLRTKKKLSLEKLADKTDLDVDELQEIENSPENVAGPLAVTELASFFKLNPSKVSRLAGLTVPIEQQNLDDCLLSFAACSSGNFSELTRDEKKMFLQIVKQLRK